MTEGTGPNYEHFFDMLCSLAHFSTHVTDISTLVQDTLQTSLESVPLEGAVIWLRANEQDMLTPGGSRLPQGCSTSAISEDNEILQRAVDEGYLLLEASAAEPLVMLPAESAIALAPVQNSDMVLGLLGHIANRAALESLDALLVASANIISAPVAAAWLRRQQAESGDIEGTLSQFARELRKQQHMEDILITLNNQAVQQFDCDWAGVYTWSDEQEGTLRPVQIVTRVGEQPLEGEPSLVIQETPLFEMVFSDLHPTSIRDLRDQPAALPVYMERHGLRGVVFVPIQHEAAPQGLLVLGYLAPLATFRSRASTLVQGLVRMVALALERTRSRQQQ